MRINLTKDMSISEAFDAVKNIPTHKYDLCFYDGRKETRYRLYWQEALDGKTWCRVYVYEMYLKGEQPTSFRGYDYRYYFRTMKDAKFSIICDELAKLKYNFRFQDNNSEAVIGIV